MSSTYQRPVVFDEYMSMFILMGAMPNNTSGGRSGGVSPSPLTVYRGGQNEVYKQGKGKEYPSTTGKFVGQGPKRQPVNGF